MVNYKTLKELLIIDDLKEKNNQLRKAFSAYTSLIDITGLEKAALIILLNLTHRKALVEDLCNEKLAKRTLLDEAHFDKCVNEIEWLHSHNLKYPDIKVSKQRLLVPHPSIISGVISGANCQRTLGWSHNSTTINCAKLFCCHFYWQGKIVCLTDLLLSNNDVFKKVFKTLGFIAEDYNRLCQRVKKLLPESDIPVTVDRFSKQVQFPFRDKYISLTPVVSHSLQAEIQIKSRDRKGRYAKLEHVRPSSMGELVASLGGNISLLSYPPNITPASGDYTEKMLWLLERGKDVFNNKILSSDNFIHALKLLIFSPLKLTHRQRKESVLTSFKVIRAGLFQWLQPIIDWRFELQDNNRVLDLSQYKHGELIFRLLTVDQVNNSITASLFEYLNNNLPERYAYHQAIVLRLRRLLTSTLNRIVKSESIEEPVNVDGGNKRFLYLRNIQVFDAQAQANPYCIGVPSLTAVWGMLHNYQRRLSERLGVTICFSSFSLFIRNYSLVKGNELPAFSMNGPNQKVFKRSGVTANRFCDLTFDIVVRLDGDEDSIEKLEQNNQVLKACFPSRFAGGAMIPDWQKINSTWCQLYQNETQLFSVLKRLPSFGQWLVPHTAKLQSLNDLTSLLIDNTNLSPVMQGFSFLGKPINRSGALDSLHCFAEPVIGVAQYMSAYKVRYNGMKHFFNKAFWSYEVQEAYILIKKAKASYGIV
ncbi:type I-F CRISPR-associated protein Csy2 [Thalassotalea piscium]|uniref:CRISPR-associated protein Csy2 n=1 Tax=Thalassotalea piscium TaxID=1230533 RepID=A0A7X0NG94_9GAMM|nr:type I-F CRISPR-associated protein Csy2 [Thalassotalea piscium]MBB6542898.1 CRISPR-associated protein Csy2 [Thalassotalea piscium]